MKRMWLIAILVLGACGSTVQRPKVLINLTAAEWQAEVTMRHVDTRETPNPLAITDSMRTEAERLAGVGSPPERLSRLQASLFDLEKFPFAYDRRGTFTAAEAFHRREGNCLSFTNLFVAMGRAMGIPVTTALVLRAPGSEQEGDLIVVNTHVIATFSNAGQVFYYDFDRTRRQQPQAVKTLDDMWITALYLNNRGADELRAGHPDIALRYFDNAVKLAPGFASAWGNVGVARRRAGDTQGAFEAYHQALSIDPGNPTILSNLAAFYRSQGREHEAAAALAAANLSVASPHMLLVKGDLELARGRLHEALALFKRARRMAPASADPLVALARLEMVRSNPSKAQRFLEKAIKLEPTNGAAQSLLDRLRRTDLKPSGSKESR